MFSQISRIADLTWKFWAKRCSLHVYAGVSGNWNFQCESYVLLPPFSLIHNLWKQNTRKNVSKISVNTCYWQIGLKSTNDSLLPWRKEHLTLPTELRVRTEKVRADSKRFPPRSKDFFFTSCGSLMPFTRANAQWVIYGWISTLIYTSELILCSTICVLSATQHNIHMYPYFLFSTIHHPKSALTFSVRPRSSVGRATIDLIRRSWVWFPPRSKDFFVTLSGSLVPLTRANTQWVIHGLN